MSLDLDAYPPPPVPGEHTKMLGVRVPRDMAVWVEDQVARQGTTVNAWLKALLYDTRRGEWLPADVVDWLAQQAMQCNCPGDIQQTIILVVRHLAERWPHGARLND